MLVFVTFQIKNDGRPQHLGVVDQLARTNEHGRPKHIHDNRVHNRERIAVSCTHVCAKRSRSIKIAQVNDFQLVLATTERSHIFFFLVYCFLYAVTVCCRCESDIFHTHTLTTDEMNAAWRRSTIFLAFCRYYFASFESNAYRFRFSLLR